MPSSGPSKECGSTPEVSDSVGSDNFYETYGVERVDDLWFPDGNIVIVAEGFCFRVYRGILEWYSVVLRDMFQTPQPEGSEKIEGCAVVRLWDEPADLGCLLGHLFCQPPVPEVNQWLDFEELAVLIRLAHKYQMDSVLEPALQHLKATFTGRFANVPIDDSWRNFLRDAPINVYGTDALVAVNLALLTKFKEILPMALYGCCQISVEHLVFGIPFRSGMEHLSQNVIVKCLRARDYLISIRHTRNERLLDYAVGIHPWLPELEPCAKAFRTAFQRATELYQLGGLSPAALDSHCNYVYALFDPELPCEDCRNAVLEKERTERDTLYKNLWRIFEIDELMAEEEGAVQGV